MTGIELIAQERQRQIEKEGYSPGHDDDHDDEELVKAASCYLVPLACRWQPPARWPWRREDWKPMQGYSDEGRVRELVKAGALIAAEIDRLQRQSPPATTKKEGRRMRNFWWWLKTLFRRALPGHCEACGVKLLPDNPSLHEATGDEDHGDGLCYSCAEYPEG